MPLTDAEKAELKRWVLSKACDEYRRGEACVQRKDSTRMIGDMREGCYWDGHILELSDNAWALGRGGASANARWRALVRVGARENPRLRHTPWLWWLYGSSEDVRRGTRRNCGSFACLLAPSLAGRCC